MIIGGQAVLLYGEPRLTRDIDITIGVGIDHLGTLLQTIEKIPLRSLPEDVAAFVKQTMVLPAIEESTGIRVDFIFSFTPYESQAIKRANHIRITSYAAMTCLRATHRQAKNEAQCRRGTFCEAVNFDCQAAVYLQNPRASRKFLELHKPILQAILAFSHRRSSSFNSRQALI